MLLFDQNISYRLVSKLSDYYPGCQQVHKLGLTNAEDIDIWDYARKNNYAIVTFDADFYDIGLLNGCPPKIIWLRTGKFDNKSTIHFTKKKRTTNNCILYTTRTKRQSMSYN